MKNLKDSIHPDRSQKTSTEPPKYKSLPVSKETRLRAEQFLRNLNAAALANKHFN